MYSRILVALDGSDTASRALDTALKLAVEHGAQLLPLYVIDVPVIAYDAPGFDPSIIRDAFEEEGKRISSDARARLEKRGVTGTPQVVEVTPPGEDVAHRINAMAAQWHADLIVMGTHGRRGFRRLVLGSVAERVLRSAACPVLMIPARAADLPAGSAAATSNEKALT
ncbi:MULTISPECIES: universal stress protein [Paraburkholderia]|jgi:nucleotide-binding universal stress UspA family protein|uniref:universal stress protein n=1 Tax=Paraburkholderia TaxID=1822464 RepID=UPI000720756E|nr:MULTISPECIES: universal stress protein [Paraburkholderia]ALP66240.1 universal stress protein UspA [Paraburkholderia caribensis]AMV45754.1 universal stress protein UspA [Paraburkholderia caribensis]AUT54827.1 universal stress protein [Paraburkholderia caribensis]CAG9192448.1 Universal stress protein UspA [Paraburkholderia caribensis]